MNKISCLVFLITAIGSLLIKFFDIELNKFLLIIFIFTVILILLYTVNDCINSVIVNIKDSEDISKNKERDDNAKNRLY